MSTVSSKDLEKAKKWCDKARTLLKTRMIFGNSEASVESEHAINAVFKSLEKLKKSKNPEYDRFANEFVELSKLGTASKKSSDQSLALVLTAQLEHLQNRIDYAAGTINQQELDKSRESLANSVAIQFEKELQSAKRRQMELLQKADGIHKFDREVTSTIEQATLVAESMDNNVRETSLTNAMVMLSEVESQYKAAVVRQTKYTEYKASKAEASLKSQQLKLVNVAYSLPVDQIITAAEKLANKFEYEVACTELKKVDKAFESSVKTNHISKEQQEYIKKMAEAQARARELATRNHDGIDYAKEINKNIKVALGIANTSTPDYVTAAKALGDTKSIYELQKKLADKSDEQRLAAARHKPVYDDKVLRINSAISELNALPGTKTFVTQLEQLLVAGENVVKSSQDYVEAYKALQGLTAAREKGLEAAASFRDTVGDDLYRTNQREAEVQLKRLDELVGRSQFAYIAEKQLSIDNSLMRMSSNGNVREETMIMGTLAVDLKRKADEVVPLKNSCEETRAEVSEQIQQFQQYGLIGEYDVLPMFRDAEAEFGVDNYSVALTQYTKVVQRLQEIEGTEGNNDAYQKWKIVLKELNDKKHLVTLDKIRSVPCKPLLKFGPLQTKKDLLFKNLSQTRDFEGAIETAEEIKKATPEIELMINQFNATSARRNELQSLSNLESKASLEKITLLEKKRGDVGEFKKLVESISNSWTTKLNGGEYATVEEWDKAFEEFKVELTNKIVAPINAMLASPGGEELLQASQKSNENKEIRKALEQNIRDIEKTINTMKADSGAFEYLGPLVATTKIGLPIIESAENALSELKVELESDPIKDVTGLERNIIQLSTGIEEVISKLETERNKLSLQAKSSAQECLDRLNSLKKSHKAFESFFSAMLSRVNDLVAMANSTVCSTVEQCLFTVNQLTSKEITPLETAFTTLDEQFSTIRINLDDNDFKTMMPDRRKTMDFRYDKELKVDVHKLGPIAGKSAVDQFEKELRAAVQDAKNAKRLRAEIKRISEECTEKLALITDAPHLQKSFEGMISSSSSPIENGEVSALQRLRSLLGQIQGLIGSESANVRQDMERVTREKEVQTQIKTQQFKSVCDILDKNQIRQATERSKELDSDKVNWDLFKQIAAVRKEADDMFKKGLLDAANEKLDAARTTALQFISNPFSIQTTARKNLGKVASRWSQTVVTFVKSINALQLALQSSMELENQQTPNKFDIGAVLKPLSEAAKTFESQKFDEYVTTITNELGKKKIDLAAVKAYRQAKEEALRFVRQYQGILAKDPVLQSVASNPFGVEVSIRNIGESLRDLELNLRRA